MYVRFYKVTDQARQDYSELCPSSKEKISKRTRNQDEFVRELNRKIRKLCNLGKLIEEKNGFKVIQYFDLLLVVREYVVEYVYKAEGLDPYEVSEEDKEKYDYIEQKVSAQITECR